LTKSLRRRVTKLEKQIADLERRINALEAPPEPEDFPRKRWGSVKEISTSFSIPESTVRYWCAHQRVKTRRIGKSWLIDRQTIPQEYDEEVDLV
jgi:hypothetical protein